VNGATVGCELEGEVELRPSEVVKPAEAALLLCTVVAPITVCAETAEEEVTAGDEAEADSTVLLADDAETSSVEEATASDELERASETDDAVVSTVEDVAVVAGLTTAGVVIGPVGVDEATEAGEVAAAAPKPGRYEGE